MSDTGHNKKCPCSICDMEKQGVDRADAIAAVEAQRRDMMSKYGWYVQAVVVDDDESPTGYNVHTHGCDESWGHPDFQVVLPIDPKIAHSIIANLVERVKEGEKFAHGDRVENIIGNDLEVMLVEATENRRTVLRIILPDADGVLPPTTETYASQLEGTAA